MTQPIWKEIIELKSYSCNPLFHNKFVKKYVNMNQQEKEKYEYCEYYDSLQSIRENGVVFSGKSAVDCSNCNIIKDFVDFYNTNQDLVAKKTQLEYCESNGFRKPYCYIREKKTWSVYSCISYLYNLKQMYF